MTDKSEQCYSHQCFQLWQQNVPARIGVGPLHKGDTYGIIYLVFKWFYPLSEETKMFSRN